MSEADFIADHLALAISGPAWHGPSFNEQLADVSSIEASARPLPGMHTIAELAAHIGVWARAVEDRLSGKPGTPNEDEQWTAIDTSSEIAWAAGLDKVRKQRDALVQAVRNLSDAQLAATVPTRTYPVATMLHGVIEHDAYHSGQIALLKKFVRAAAESR